MATNLYLITPSLKPYEPVNSFDIRYINQSCFSIINPLSKPVNIELYNETWFDKPPRTSKTLFDYKYSTVVFLEHHLSTFTSSSDLHAETKTISPSPFIEKSDTDIIFPTFPKVLSESLSASDCLFFIRYTLEDNFKQRWFLVQVNHVASTILNTQPETTGYYHVIFLARNPDDKILRDDKSR